MKLQAVYNKVKKHLLAQNKRSVLTSTPRDCAYLAPDGSKCAVGCLIKKKYYNTEIEGWSVASTRVETALTNSGVEVTENGMSILLDCLRNIHDHREPKEWKKELVKLAKEFKLKP